MGILEEFGRIFFFNTGLSVLNKLVETLLNGWLLCVMLLLLRKDAQLFEFPVFMYIV